MAFKNLDSIEKKYDIRTALRTSQERSMRLRKLEYLNLT
jgi:hypothetical protein